MGKQAQTDVPDFVPFDSGVGGSILTKNVRKLRKSMKTKKLEEEEKEKRGIILISHLPYGFFEAQLKKFFKQFGIVTRVRLARSAKTGRPRGYAFIEFKFREVAQIAAESMNNYLMYERIIKCKLLESELDSKEIFDGSKIREDKFPALFRRRKLLKDQAQPLDAEAIKMQKFRKKKKILKHNQKLEALGIKYRYSDDSTGNQIADQPVSKSSLTLPELSSLTSVVVDTPSPKVNDKYPMKSRKSASPKQGKVSPVNLNVSASKKRKRTSSEIKSKSPRSAKASPKSISSSPLQEVSELKSSVPESKSSRTPQQADRNSLKKIKTPNTSNRISISPGVVAVDTEFESTPKEAIVQIKKNKSKKTPDKFSPKMLRSGKIQKLNSAEKKVPKRAPESSPKSLKLTPKPAISEGDVESTPKGTKAKKLVATSHSSVELKSENEKKSKELKSPKDKLSPKMLRKRKNQELTDGELLNLPTPKLPRKIGKKETSSPKGPEDISAVKASRVLIPSAKSKVSLTKGSSAKSEKKAESSNPEISPRRLRNRKSLSSSTPITPAVGKSQVSPKKLRNGPKCVVKCVVKSLKN